MRRFLRQGIIHEARTGSDTETRRSGPPRRLIIYNNTSMILMNVRRNKLTQEVSLYAVV